MPVNPRKEKPGYKTTEFWITLAILLAATVLRLTDDVSEGTWALAAGLSGGTYSLSRGLAKAG